MQKLQHRVLAEGEVTGHAHRADAGTLFDAGAGVMVLDAPEGATVTHEEHGLITLPPGQWTRRIVQEYDHAAEAAREVVD
jgi:hypothetical protein